MKHIKIKLDRSEVNALHNLFLVTLSFCDSPGFKNTLIKEIMLEVLDKLDKMIHNREQKKFTIKLTSAQCLSFMAYSEMIPLERTPYEAVIINRINSEIHKTHANAYARF